jgi:hypothetical protein
MDEIHLAVDLALDCLANHWRRGFIERSHGQIARQKSTRMFREYVDQQFIDIDDVLSTVPIVNLSTSSQ